VFKRGQFKPGDLELVLPATSLRKPSDPPLTIGAKVRLNSGSEELTVVDISDDGALLTVAWLGPDMAPHEITAPSICFTENTLAGK
jgi:hypothetical protein